MNHNRILPLSALLLLTCTQAASAHVGHAHDGFAAGVTHPLGGLDHVLAMVGVGLWAATVGGRARWAVPLAFVAAMIGGGVLQWTVGGVPHVEAGIATSVFVLGLLVAAGARLPVVAAAALAGLFAACHGAAHATEFAGGSAVGYGVGFAIATAALHAVGLAMPVFGKLPVRLAGGAMAACAVLSVVGVV